MRRERMRRKGQGSQLLRSSKLEQRGRTHELLETDLLEKVLVPPLAPLDARRDVRALARQRAVAPRLVARRFEREPIGQIKELALLKDRLGHVLLEPEDLRDLHLEAHRPADVLEHHAPRRVDRLGLVVRAVVGPEDDVAFSGLGADVGAPGSGSDGLGSAIEGGYGKRAGRVEADPAYECVGDTRLAKDVLARLRDAVPDCRRGAKSAPQFPSPPSPHSLIDAHFLWLTARRCWSRCPL